jgi:hypothetical protein
MRHRTNFRYHGVTMNRLVESSIAPPPTDRLRPLRYVLRIPQLLLHAIISVPLSLLALNPLAEPGGTRQHRPRPSEP